MVKRPASKMAGAASVSAMLQADVEALMKKYEDVMMPADVAGKLAQTAQLAYETLAMRDRIRAHPFAVSGDPSDRSLDNQSPRIAEEATVTSIHRAETGTSFLIDARVQIQSLQLHFHYSTRMLNKPGVPTAQLLTEPCTRVDFWIEGSNGLQPSVQLIQATIYGRGTAPSQEKIPIIVDDDGDDDEGGDGGEGGEMNDNGVEVEVSEQNGEVDAESGDGSDDGGLHEAAEADLVSLAANLEALTYLCKVLGVDEDPQAMVYFLMSFPFVDDAWDVPEVVLGAICEESDDDDDWEDVDDDDGDDAETVEESS